jgi:PAS domain S-box-containing protein
MRAPLHPQEAARLQALRETGLLDSAAQALHDAVVKLAADLCGTPIAAISLVDTDRQWFPAITGLDCKETPRDVAFCAHAILQDEPLVVPDATADPRFADNGLVTGGPGIRFYAGIPLKTQDDLPLGSLCVIDTSPREITPHQLRNLHTLGGLVAAQLDLARRSNQLQSSESLKRMLVDHATDFAMITLDAQGVVTSWNAGAERLKGFTAAERIGVHFGENFVPEERAAGVPQRLLAEAAAKGRAEVCSWHLRKDGSQYHVAGSITAVCDAENRCTGFIKVTRDDTAAWLTAQQLEHRTAEIAEANRRLAEQAIALQARTAELEVARAAAEDASRSKSEFLANMSHEIRTPMTAILGFADMLAVEAEGKSATQLDWISTIRRNGEHLLTIINDILDLSKIEAGRMTVESAEVNPGALITDALQLMDVSARAKDLQLAAEFDGPLPARVSSDPLRLRQILVNLIGNAIKFTASGSVTLRASYDAESSTLRFSITDTGIGMTSEQLGRLFGAFVQADTSTTRRFGGTGLGLRISKRLAEMLGGDITIASTPGQGSTFTLTVRAAEVVTQTPSIPSGTVPPPGLAAMMPTTPSLPPLAGLRVLLAEDGEDNRRLISFHLTKAGATVTTAVNGRLAIEALTANGADTGPLAEAPRFDILLTDMQMPELDGYETARRLRSMGCTMPIVALTACAMSGDVERCLAAGCDAYASKPIDRAALISTCLRVIAARAASSQSA